MGDDGMSWKAANETIREGGKLHVLTVLPQLLRYKKLDDKPTYDPEQFAFLRGNEECAREWQDPQNY